MRGVVLISEVIERTPTPTGRTPQYFHIFFSKLAYICPLQTFLSNFSINNQLKMDNTAIIIYQTEDGKTQIQTRLDKETVWLTQAQLCTLFQKSKSTISEHIKHISSEGELEESAVVRKFRTTADDGKDYQEYEKFKERHKNDLSTAELHFIHEIEKTVKEVKPKK